MEIRFGKVSELLKPEEEVIVVKIGDINVVEKLDVLKLLKELPYLEENEADKIGLEAKSGRESSFRYVIVSGLSRRSENV